MTDLRGKAAIVTGAAHGIGAACAGRLAELGASVTATDVDDDEGAGLAERLSKDGSSVTYRHQDVADEASWREVVDAVREANGGLHILVNNAGIGTLAAVEDETLEDWDRLISINQTGTWLGMKHAGPAIRDSGGGSIINISSIFGAVGGFGGSIAYHASKGAVRLMTKNAALHWATQGVRVNSVHPGFIDTPMIDQVKGTDVEQAILQMTPMARLGRPEEIANAVAFLAGDEASYMTGSEVYVDGGWTAR